MNGETGVHVLATGAPDLDKDIGTVWPFLAAEVITKHKRVLLIVVSISLQLMLFIVFILFIL